MGTTNKQAPVEDRLTHLATEFQAKAEAFDREGDWVGHGDELSQYLRDHAYSLAQFAHQVREEYARIHGDEPEEIPTKAQGIALARFLVPHFRKRETASARVSRGGAGLPADYLHVAFIDGYEGGIAPDGTTST